MYGVWAAALVGIIGAVLGWCAAFLIGEHGLSRLLQFAAGVMVGVSAFEGCTALDTVFLPKSLCEISSSAFYGCGITDVYYAGSREEWAGVTVADGNEALLTATFHFGA